MITSNIICFASTHIPNVQVQKYVSVVHDIISARRSNTKDFVALLTKKKNEKHVYAFFCNTKNFAVLSQAGSRYY